MICTKSGILYFTKTKNYVKNYARYTTLKKIITVCVGTYDCYENIKIKLSAISILKSWHCRNV